MSTLIVNELRTDEFSPTIPLIELGYRVIKSFRQTYTSGEWNPDNNYNWVPGMFADYTPESASSRIRVYCSIPAAGRNAAHAISHWIFYANGSEIGRHSRSANHYENNHTYTWDFASWGTSAGRIGYQMRSPVQVLYKSKLLPRRIFFSLIKLRNRSSFLTFKLFHLLV